MNVLKYFLIVTSFLQIGCNKSDSIKSEVILSGSVLSLLEMYIDDINVDDINHYPIVLIENQLLNDTMKLTVMNEHIINGINKIECEQRYRYFSEHRGFDIYVFSNSSNLIDENVRNVDKVKPPDCDKYLPKNYNGEIWSVKIWKGRIVALDFFFTELDSSVITDIYSIKNWN